MKSLIKKGLNMTEDDILIPFSAVTKMGTEQILSLVEELLLPDEDVTEEN